jgi:lysophospholipase L1-like esterase
MERRTTRSGAVPSRPLWARIAVALAAVVLAFVLAEGIARVAFPGWAPRTARLTDFWRYDPRYGWSHIPGAHGTFRSHGVDADVVINTKGFRGPEVSYDRTPGRPRVLFLGDSFTWGFGVGFDDIFAARLQRLVPGLEAVNLGVSGYSTDQELLLYQDEGRRYRPDLVVVVVAYNDSLGNDRTVEYVVYGKPAFVLSGDRLQLVNQPVAQPGLATRAFTRMAWRSYILTQVHRALYEVGLGRSLVHATAPESMVATATAASVPPRLGNWTLTARLLVELARATRADGADLLVVFADGIPAAPAVARALETHGVGSIALDGVLDVRDPRVHLPDALHWNALGHTRVAEALAEPIREMLARRPR